MLIPIRIEYLANPRYGLDLSNVAVLVLVCVIPNVARILATPFIGAIFDRTRLITTRLIVNGIFLGGIVLFFHGKSFLSLALGSAFFGVAMAGSFVLHSLWLTKFVPSERLPTYTSLYLMTTGIRSVLAPLVGYVIMGPTSPTIVGDFAIFLLLLSSIGFWSLRRTPQLCQDPENFTAQDA
jgi:MFS-type transporter involved in bile tolerance (Atg22 family)